MAVIGAGFEDRTLTETEAKEILQETFADTAFDDQRLLVIIPDGTRTAPIPLIFKLLYEHLGHRVKQLDYLIALGTHRAMSEEAIETQDQ